MSKIHWTMSAVLFAAACVVTAPQARAETLGTFTLPVKAHFGGAVLPPGDYTVARVDGMSALRVTGPGGTATMLASSAGPEMDRENSKLTLVNVNGVFTLERFDSGALGMRFDFAVPRVQNVERASSGQPSSLEVALK
ncbi:MAG TPA: hypothetical protein VKS01_09000 [Bryobacteraceae bacterium]|nr:hypothetical protein [Bryobacteraceae bacterium]